jgi:NAD(P)-dependent dehydrogenase (short-subunit alcohol dehydrogenase family)
VDKIVEQTGAIHGMVCNAGRTKHKAALDFTTEEIDQLWGVNVSDSSESGFWDEGG